MPDPTSAVRRLPANEWPLYSWLERFFSSRRWQFKLLVLAVGLALTMQVPGYLHLYRYAVAGTEVNSFYETFRKQVEAPFTARPADPESHDSKMTFRLTVPLLVRALHLPPVGVYALQFLAGLLMYGALIRLLFRITQDRVATALLVLGLSCTYFGCAFAYDVNAYFDAFSYVLLVLMLGTTRPGWLFLLMLVGAFNDERTMLAVPVVALWHLCQQPAFGDARSYPLLARLMLRNKAVRAIGLGIVAYAGVRLALGSYFQLTVPGGMVGVSALVLNVRYNFLETGFLSGLESYWLLVLLALVVLLTSRAYRLAALLLLALAPIGLGAFLVLDITRSLAYLMPVVVLAVYLLRPALSRAGLRHLAAGLLVGALLTPTIHIEGALHVAPSVFTHLMTRILAGEK